MIRAIVVEDQPPAQRIIKKYAEDLGTIEIVALFSDAIQAIAFLQQEQIDLLFLDIHLPKLSGIDFLKSQSNLPPVILTTAFSDYALESYEYEVVDYLLKPFSFARFVQAVQKVQAETTTVTAAHVAQAIPSNSPEFIMLKSGYDYIKVQFSDIQYIKSDSDYTEVYTLQKKYLSNHRLRYWNENLPNNQFCQIHKSVIINLSYLTRVTGNLVYLNDVELSIGRAYKESLVDKLDM